MDLRNPLIWTIKFLKNITAHFLHLLPSNENTAIYCRKELEMAFVLTIIPHDYTRLQKE